MRFLTQLILIAAQVYTKTGDVIALPVPTPLKDNLPGVYQLPLSCQRDRVDMGDT